jgi:hypothetical protein
MNCFVLGAIFVARSASRRRFKNRLGNWAIG